MKKSFYYAFVAAAYIVVIVNVINAVTHVLPHQTIIIPMVMLSLFVLSAAVMGFLFLSEPIQLYLSGQKNEAIAFFGRIVGFFACFTIFFLILYFLI